MKKLVISPLITIIFFLAPSEEPSEHALFFCRLFLCLPELILLCLHCVILLSGLALIILIILLVVIILIRIVSLRLLLSPASVPNYVFQGSFGDREAQDSEAESRHTSNKENPGNEIDEPAHGVSELGTALRSIATQPSPSKNGPDEVEDTENEVEEDQEVVAEDVNNSLASIFVYEPVCSFFAVFLPKSEKHVESEGCSNKVAQGSHNGVDHDGVVAIVRKLW